MKSLIANRPKRIPTISLKSVLSAVTIVLFSALIIWWILLRFIEGEQGNLLWAASYQSVALLGGILGIFIISRLWGGIKSVMGRAIIFLSLGLLFQVFGQSVFSFYNIFLMVEVPYPSLADIGFFGSIPFYIYGIVLLGKVSHVRISLKSFKKGSQAILIPSTLILISYASFLRDYQIESFDPIRIFLDFAYPIGQAIYVSIAVLVYTFSRNILGGIMRNKILLILAALVIQYIADFNFLFQAIQGTWTNGGYGDVIYLVAYFLMTLSLVRLVGIFDRNDTESTNPQLS